MKINISYRPDGSAEDRQVRIIRSFLESFLPGAKVSISNRNIPYLHIHWSTKKAENQTK